MRCYDAAISAFGVVQGHPWLYSGLEASLSYLRTYLKQNKIEKSNKNGIKTLRFLL